jgi:hypothetical protein
MIRRDAALVRQNMFGITPEPLDPIAMIFHWLPTYEAFGVVDRMMLSIPVQGLIAPRCALLHG